MEVSLVRWISLMCSLLSQAVAQNASINLAASQVLTDPFPYHYPNEDAAPTALFPMPPCKGVTLEEATIDQLQGYMGQGLLTAVDILGCYFARYNQVNGYVNGILEWNPDALDIAQALDVERAAGHVRGPLHGIPFLVKDNIATKDQMDTTAGSWMLVGSVVPRDAHVVMKLRNAGALLMGHATLSEWADMSGSRPLGNMADILTKSLGDQTTIPKATAREAVKPVVRTTSPSPRAEAAQALRRRLLQIKSCLPWVS
jgi:amidase